MNAIQYATRLIVRIMFMFVVSVIAGQLMFNLSYEHEWLAAIIGTTWLLAILPVFRSVVRDLRD